MGLNNRESRLVDRVKDVENQNRFLRRQLSISQGQIMKTAIIKKQNQLKRQHNQRRSAIDQSYDANNNNINYDTGGVMDDADEQQHTNEENSQDADGKESSKCGVRIIITISIVTMI